MVASVHYRLDYQIAEVLVELARKQGAHTWKAAKYLGAQINIKAKIDKKNWPTRMPAIGHLWVKFVPDDLDAVDVSELTAKQFDLVWRHIVGRNQRKLTDEWIVEYASVLAHVLYFSAGQVLEMSRAVEWSSSRIRLVLAVFSSITDPSHTDVLEQGMLPQEWDACLDSLGSLASFTPANPTGRYSFNLSLHLDFAVVARLRVMYINEAEDGLCGHHTQCAFRNVTLNGAEVAGMENGRATVAAIRAWSVPLTGSLNFDFVSFRTPRTEDVRPESFEYFLELLGETCTPTTSRKVWGTFDRFDNAAVAKVRSNARFAAKVRIAKASSVVTSGLHDAAHARSANRGADRSSTRLQVEVHMLKDALKTVCGIDAPAETFVKRNTVVFTAGDPNTHAYYFLTGSGATCKPPPQHKSSNTSSGSSGGHSTSTIPKTQQQGTFSGSGSIEDIAIGNFAGEVGILMDEPCHVSTLKASADSWMVVVSRESLLQIFDSQHELAKHLAALVETKHAAEIAATMCASMTETPLRTPYNTFMYYYNRAAGRQGRTPPSVLSVAKGQYVYRDASATDQAYFVASGHLNIEADVGTQAGFGRGCQVSAMTRRLISSQPRLVRTKVNSRSFLQRAPKGVGFLKCEWLPMLPRNVRGPDAAEANEAP